MRHLVILLALAAPAPAADPWHLPAWKARAAVEVAKASPDAGCDVCGVRVLLHGRAKADGSDLRVVDAGGKAVPFQVMHLDAERYALVSFKADAPRGKYFVYFANPAAARSPDEVVADAAPGKGAPKGKWVPKFGFVLQTIERPKGDNPRTLDELAKMLAASKAKHGARYQRRVSDGYNAFGSSDYYMSVYRGWVRVPKAGKYQFCTISNEASFSYLDGKELISWPGRHTVDRGVRGEVNSLVELTEGLHYLEYYHEEVTLEQMAFLGWRPSADEGAFGPIPETFFTAPHEGKVLGYEDAAGPLPAFEATIADSCWPADRAGAQYTRVAFEAVGVDAKAVTWDFGDGVTATGAKASHVFLTLGTFVVKMTVGGKTAAEPVRVFEIEHVVDQFKEAKPGDFVNAVAGYDRDKLSAAALAEMTELHSEADDLPGVAAVGAAYLRRFAEKGDALRTARVRRLLADAALRSGDGKLDEVVKNYEDSLVKEVPTTERLEVMARLIRLVGIDRKQPDRAAAILGRAEKVAKGEGVDDDGRRAFRRAVANAGDAMLWAGKSAEAQKLYARAERLYPTTIPPQVRAARIGAYPNTLREYVAAGNFGAALDVVDQWEDLFATDRLNGQSFFWRGKVLSLRGQPREAAKYLDRCVKIAVGAATETEARWLLAETLFALKRDDDARKELAKLVSTGLRDDFVKKAADRLKK